MMLGSSASSKNSLGSALDWYQKKLGSYDQQLWEKSIEERVLRGINHAVPKRVAKPNSGLIDLDLIRGSAFTKAKPQQGCIATTYLGIIRVILFPFYIKWWTDQTNSHICAILFSLYSLQLSSMYICFSSDIRTSSHKDFEDIPDSEVLVPVVMFLILSVIQSHIAASHSLDERNRSRDREVTPRPSRTIRPFQPTVVRRKRRSPDKRNLHKKAGEKHSVRIAEKENVDPGVPPEGVVGKKASDDESGLESMDVKFESSSSSSLRERRSFSGPKVVIPEVSDHSSSPKDSPKRPLSRTGEEGDHEGDACEEELSTPEEISPYSTINSASGVTWTRRYSDIVNRRLRSLSSTGPDVRRFSSEVESSRRRATSLVKNVRRKSPVKQVFCSNLSEKETRPNSSCESEGSLSPTTPNKGTATDMEWPLINSEGSSEEDDYDEAAQTIEDPPVGRSSSLSGVDYPFVRDEDLFAGDPDSLPPQIFSFCDEWISGPRVTDSKKIDDKGIPKSSRVSCAIWQQNECQKVDLTVLDISSAVIRKVGKAKHSNEYFFLGLMFSVILAFIPGLFRLQSTNGSLNGSGSILTVFGPVNDPKKDQINTSNEMLDTLLYQLPVPAASVILESMVAPSTCWLIRYVVMVAIIERFCMSMFFFFLLCVAERTYKERFMFSKYFCHLTSARRARRSELPHFRLNKVRNIKTWLSVRSYLKKHGPQRSVDIIVSCSFILAVVILTFLCIQLLRESSCSSYLYCWEMLAWSLAIGIYIMRLIVLGSKMNRKYKGNLSVLITEQINLYLQLEQKPHKKEELTLANHVLKLAADLLKQLEAPFKISGFSANHYLYNITKVVVLSAFSAVLTEMLGFKLKLHKIKL